MAYDPATGQMLLFGGGDGVAALGDTWMWTGSSWTKKSTPQAPSSRYLTSMAFDTGTGQVVLFGGNPFGSGYDGDTWTWGITAPIPTGKGYWLVDSDGGIFTFGDAGYFGSAGTVKLSRPVVGAAAA
jgi:hypothetical protein